jgi:hypothetical protein
VFRLLVSGTVLAIGIAAAGAPAMAQREREHTGSPPNALPPVPVLPTYNAPVNPGYSGPVARQRRLWVPPAYDRYGNVVPGYWR